jgi:hypothetical protein
VLARDPGSAWPAAVWIDLTDQATVSIDRDWYRAAGLRASVSHRVSFDGAQVLARFGPPGGLSTQPWFSRDALRTAASWAGMVDAAVDAALEELAGRPRRSELDELAAGRILMALHARAAIATAAHAALAEAAGACGSHPFAVGGELDRARRDLELFLLQHRLAPAIAAAGARALSARTTRPS